ncbi:hypothetical protein FEM48_Zijuj05G0139000 [Ziziphus jujuba var. spinosa]|uniref:HNH domain-containing protein n=1 Tax=Ziziphus jujuba var. spinosa TaxID=714518 RepID=A0A978VF78_ZIZJJ|nr:hypothetical protein FEM48_Zijuj05G0139000 [Ziziphus jujuba var. spinosa]
MTSSSSPSPQRSRGENSNRNGEDSRPRFFDAKARSVCWAKADVVPGRHPDRWRKDAAGNIVCKRFSNCLGCLCFEYDHIVPFSKGGESVAENCQILQTRVNRLKSAKDHVDANKLKGYSCDVNFTEESSVAFPVSHTPYVSHENCPNASMMNCLGSCYAYLIADKELDIIEMAVYGDVIRPGNQCRCRTVAEMLGQYKSKDSMAACKLPYNEEAL